MKKIISAVLALVMCVSLMGGVSISAEDVTRPNGRYDFITKYVDANTDNGRGSKYGINNKDTTIYDKNKPGILAIYDYGDHGWKGLGVSYKVENDLQQDFNGRMTQFSNTGLQIRRYHSTYIPNALKDIQVAVLLEAPTEGIYSVETNIAVSSDVTIYMGKYKNDIDSEQTVVDLNGYMNGATYLGEAVNNTVGFSAGDLSGDYTPCGRFIHSDGETPIVLLLDVQGTRAATDAILRSLKLTSSALAPQLQVGNTELEIGETSELDVRVGGKVNVNLFVNDFIDYSVKDGSSDVVTVDPDGVVTAHAPGTKTIVIKVGDTEFEQNFTVKAADAPKTYYFRYAQSANSFVGVDGNKYTGASAIFVNSYENHNWKFLGFSENAEEHADNVNYFRLAQMDGDDINLRNTSGDIPALSYIETGFELEAPKTAGFYQISMQTSTCYRWFYTGPVIDGKVDVEDYIDAPITDITDASYPTNDSHFVAQTSMADDYSVSLDYPRLVYSDGTTPMFLGFNLQSGNLMTLTSYTLKPVSGEAELKVENSTLKTGGTTKASVYVGENTLVNSFVENGYESSNACVTIDENGNIVANSVGTAEITAKVGKETLTATVTVYEEDEALKNAFTHTERDDNYTYVAPSMTGLTVGGQVINADKNSDGSYNIEAPAEDKDGNKFLYWAKGMEKRKKIVSFSYKLENYVPENNGTNFIIAVYEGDIADATTPEYYNIDGQLIAKSNTAPAYPSVPGLGTAIDWEDCAGNIKVAKYADMVRDNVTVTVEGGTGTQENVPYGTLITCTATATDNSGNPFKCWKKTIGDTTEIVSIDSTYKFRAWENCTVTAVYEEHTFNGTAMKIIIDSFAVGSDTGVMAEFIGLAGAVEKGIMFTDSEENTTKIAMTTKDNQFTVIADKPGTYVGYAILKNGTANTLITDGSYEHN